MSVDLDHLARLGFAVIQGILPPAGIARLIDAIDATGPAAGRQERNSRVYAMRNLLRVVREVRQLAQSAELRSLVEPVLGRNARPVRGLLFDKTLDSNWKVAWHQDLSIAVRRRIDVPGFGPWSVKAGVQHVQPPVELLQQILTVRLHLDDCNTNNGPLLVLQGSHLHGTLAPHAIERMRQEVPPVECIVPRGGELLMRPLLLHASSSAKSPAHRRVIHFEYASCDLPGGLEWEESCEN